MVEVEVRIGHLRSASSHLGTSFPRSSSYQVQCRGGVGFLKTSGSKRKDETLRCSLKPSKPRVNRRTEPQCGALLPFSGWKTGWIGAACFGRKYGPSPEEVTGKVLAFCEEIGLLNRRWFLGARRTSVGRATTDECGQVNVARKLSARSISLTQLQLKLQYFLVSLDDIGFSVEHEERFFTAGAEKLVGRPHA